MHIILPLRPLGYERVYLPICKVANAPCHILTVSVSSYKYTYLLFKILEKWVQADDYKFRPYVQDKLCMYLFNDVLIKRWCNLALIYDKI